jgi:hypothetical protein
VYSLRFAANPTGATLVGTTYTAGAAAGTDRIEVVAQYAANAKVFAHYGDNGAAGSYVVRVLEVRVKEPTITPAGVSSFVGGAIGFTLDHEPVAVQVTANVAGSRYDRAAKRFVAGGGPIAADAVETVTFDYGCKQYPVAITVHPIVAVIAPATVNAGATAQITVTGGQAPYRYAVTTANSPGATVDASGRYTAGRPAAEVTDTITVTDANGGRARVDVRVRPAP